MPFLYFSFQTFLCQIKAVTTKLDDLISCIKADQTKRVKTEDPIVINIFVAGENPEQSTTGMNGHFVHFLLLIDVLLRMKSTEKDRKELSESVVPLIYSKMFFLSEYCIKILFD